MGQAFWTGVRLPSSPPIALNLKFIIKCDPDLQSEVVFLYLLTVIKLLASID